WFGFNAGSALSSGVVAVSAFVVTHAAAASGGLIWALLEWKLNGKPTVFGTITGVIAGLATITPASGFVTPLAGLLIGAVAGLICYLFVAFVKNKLRYDDSLDAFGVHGVGGILGTLAAGLFATTLVNSGGANGLFYGGTGLFGIQLFAVVAVALYTFVVTFLIYKVVDLFMGVRVAEKEEEIGLDLTEHREAAYTVLE
ncbi:MAG: ammonia channel protein, partial [Candidatus Margulisbacteria bacterium]|nr:ammonia channel protein [Candidatus Margulisiibacteriota bacterium]